VSHASDLSAPEARHGASPALSRFRFRLKTLFVLVTLVSLWLGYKTIREQHAAAILNRRNAVLDIIITNVATPPTDTFYRINPGSMDNLGTSLGRSSPGDRFYRDAILRAGGTGTISSQNLLVDVSMLLKDHTRVSAARLLVGHYASGLAKIGLVRRLNTDEARTSHGSAKDVWTAPHNQLTVIIDTEIAADDLQAHVRILFIDSQQLRLW
jgi:hypothetical protein